MTTLDLAAYPSSPDVTGDLRVHRGFPSAHLGRSVDVTVWLPPGYDASAARYPVVYFHDGTNLWDAASAYMGAEWQVDEALADLAERGCPLIAVATSPHATERMEEYSPFFSDELREEYGAPRGASHRDFVVSELKPAVDALLRTRPDAASTAVAGSSAGGNMALWMWATRPETFGLCIALSPALWANGEAAWAALEEGVERRAAAGDLGRVAVAVGGHEGAGDDEALVNALYVSWTEAAVELLRDADVPLHYTYDAEAIHHESTWAEQLPAALRFVAGVRGGR